MTPRLTIRLLKHRVGSFRFFGAMGFALGLVLMLTLSAKVGLATEIILLLGALEAATLLGLAWVSGKVTSRDALAYYHSEIIFLWLATGVLTLLRLPVLTYLDLAILSMGTSLALGRIGCFSVGCCHGRPCPHGVKYGREHVEAGFTWYYRDVPLFPVQLVESAYVGGVVVVGTVLLGQGVRPGTVLLWYIVAYGAFRFIVEFYRGDPERASWMGLSEAQWTAVALVFATWCLGRLGWLPAYAGHGAVLLGLLVISVLRIRAVRRNVSHQLVPSSPHPGSRRRTGRPRRGGPELQRASRGGQCFPYLAGAFSIVSSTS